MKKIQKIREISNLKIKSIYMWIKGRDKPIKRTRRKKKRGWEILKKNFQRFPSVKTFLPSG